MLRPTWAAAAAASVTRARPPHSRSSRAHLTMRSSSSRARLTMCSSRCRVVACRACPRPCWKRWLQRVASSHTCSATPRPPPRHCPHPPFHQVASMPCLRRLAANTRLWHGSRLPGRDPGKCTPLPRHHPAQCTALDSGQAAGRWHCPVMSIRWGCLGRQRGQCSLGQPWGYPHWRCLLQAWSMQPLARSSSSSRAVPGCCPAGAVAAGSRPRRRQQQLRRLRLKHRLRLRHRPKKT
mmetsp:Transcript_19039/g.48390  ORF Transcript_19039/g.48390 Transcript_19039/m.48390 type:complete len:237 (+) Transcript_19039:693-1403(+)